MKDLRALEMQSEHEVLQIIPHPEEAIDKILQLIHSKIKEKKLTQLKIQEIWNWKGSYISQVLHKSKHLRLRDFLMILYVMDIRPQTFLAEIYPPEPEAVAEALESEKNIAQLKDTLSDLGTQLEQLFKPTSTSDAP